MTALREYARDASIPERAGDARLRPPVPEEALALARSVLVLPTGPELVDATWEHARWSPHEACTALFRVATSDGRELRLCVERRAHARGRAIRAGQDARLADVLPGLRPLAELADGTLIWWFPADRALPGARRLHDLSRTRRLLASSATFAGLTIRGRHSRLALLRYKPGQRAVMELAVAVRDADDVRSEVRLAVRALPPRKAQHLLVARAACRASAALGPRIVAHEERSGLVFEEWLAGHTAAPEDFTDVCDVARMLAELHAEMAPGPMLRDGAEFLDPLAVDPRLWTRAQGLASRRLPRADAAVWIHGDLHPDQVLRRADGSKTLLDWDALRPGERVEDLASWWVDALVAGADGDGVLDALLQAYASCGGRPPERTSLRAWAAHGLVRRAAAAIRRIEAGALDEAARLLELAEEIAP